MSDRNKRLYHQLAVFQRTTKKEIPKDKTKVESLEDYMVDSILSFIPKSKFLENLTDGLSNGKVHRISRR